MAHTTPELDALVSLFYPRIDALGNFMECSAADLPDAYRRLLHHDEHMTVAVETQHASPVDVDVLTSRIDDSHYSRKILLRRQSDAAVVQFGIVRLNLTFLNDDVRSEIEHQQAPLGRILINHDVLRNVRLLSLWRIETGAELSQLFKLGPQECCYGRTALIYCNSVPAVELLEIVASV